MTVCCVMGCISNGRKKDPGINFHRLPKNLSARNKWIEKIGRRNWNPGPNTYICSLHFEESSINRTLDAPCVKDNCFPTKYLPRPPATPSTSGISTNKSHDQLSSLTDMANTVRCSVPFCVSGFKTSGKSHGISFFKFPKDPNIRKEWVKALGIKNWEAKSSYTICSEHFKEESFYETMHGRMMLYPDAIPFKNLDLDAPAALMVCRICLTVDSNMQHVSKFSQVFHRVTGLVLNDSESCRLPQLLCWECAARLKSAASFRHRALCTDAILRGILKPDTYIRIRDIKSINRKSYGLKTSLVQKLIDSEHYDMNILDTFIDTDHIKTEYDLEEGIPELLENDAQIVINNFKENDSVECGTNNNNSKALENKPEKNENCIAIEDISNICQSDNNIKTILLGSGNDESDSKYVMLQNNDEGSNVKFVILQNSDKQSDVQYVVVQNGDEENNLKYMKVQNDNEGNNLKYMLQNDNCKLKTEDSIHNNEIVTEEINDEDLLEEYLCSDDDTTEIVGESDNPEKTSKMTIEENLNEFDIGVKNLKNARQNKTIARVRKIPARKMDNSRAVSGHKKINNEDITKYENLFEITDLTFEQQREEIFKRQEHASYINSPYKCTVCFTGLLEKSVFDRHVLKHTDTCGKFECTVCKIRKKKRSLLNRHLILSHSREYRCLKCDYVTRNSESALTHVQYHKGKRYQCKKCPLVFNKASSYLGHMRLVHVNSCVCEYCGFTFVSQRGVATHKNLLHKLDKDLELKGPYCKECDVTFLTEDAYSRHLKLSLKHLQDESDPERIRNEPKHVHRTPSTIMKPRTSSKRYLRVIKKRKPVTCERVRKSSMTCELVRRSPVTCEQCGEVLRTYHRYALHFLSRHPGLSRTQYPLTTPLICEQCGKMFSSLNALSCHKWVHTGQKLFQCDHCDKSFTHKGNLRDHLKSITEGQPRYQCSECGKIFGYLCNLKKHEVIHSHVQFECDICSKSYNTNTSLHQHKQHTHFKKPWPRKKKPKITEEK